MLRGLILGALALAAALLAQRQLAAARRDIARYDRLQRMSDAPPFAHTALRSIRQVVGTGVRRNGAAGYVQAFVNDAARYVRMSTM